MSVADPKSLRDVMPLLRHYRQRVAVVVGGHPAEVIPARARSQKLYNDGHKFRVAAPSAGAAGTGFLLNLAVVEKRGSYGGWWFTSTIHALAALRDTRVGFSGTATVKAVAAKRVRRELAKHALLAEGDSE